MSSNQTRRESLERQRTISENKISPSEKMASGLDMAKGDVDVALGVYEDVQDTHAADAVDKRALLWKIDLRLMPLMSVFPISYLDSTKDADLVKLHHIHAAIHRQDNLELCSSVQPSGRDLSTRHTVLMARLPLLYRISGLGIPDQLAAAKISCSQFHE